MQNRRAVEKFIMLNWRVAGISVKIDHYLPMNRHKVPSNLTPSYKWRQRHLCAICLLFSSTLDIHGTEPQVPQTYLKLSDETHTTHAVGILW